MGDCRLSVTPTARRKRRVVIPTSSLTVVLLGLVCAPITSGQRSFRTEDLEAAMLERITSFIQWPGQARTDKRDFVVTILGAAAIAPRLTYLYERRRPQGLSPRVRHISSRSEIGETHVLFIGAEFATELEAILALLAGRATLTVGNTPGFAKRGVAVNLIRDNDRMRFEVNRKALEHAGLRASYQLLNLAKLVTGGSE
jgi:hypothetical protein